MKTRHLHFVSVLLSLFWFFASSTYALHESDVGVLDWHKELIGVPAAGHISTAPQFHAVKSEPGRSLILSVSENNVLAALEAYDGRVAWRHVYDEDDRILLYHKNDHVIVTLSGPGGSWLRIHDILTGQLLRERQLHPFVDGHISEPSYLGKSIVFSDDLTSQPDIYVLTNGHTINYLDGKTAQPKWQWTAKDRASRVIYSKLVATRTVIYVVGIGPAKEGYKLCLTSLDPATGKEISTSDVPSKIKEPITDLLIVHTSASKGPDARGRVLWLEKGVLKSVGLNRNVKASKPRTFEGLKFNSIVDAGLARYGWFVAVTEEGLSRIFKVLDDGLDVVKVWDFSTPDPEDATVPSLYAGGFDIKGREYMARLFWSSKQGKPTADVYCTQLSEGLGVAADFTFPFDSQSHGLISHVALESDHPGGLRIFSRVMTTSSTGALQLWHGDQLQWTREEDLASIAAAEFVEMPQGEKLASSKGDTEGFVRRLVRQIVDAKDLPEYLLNFVYRFTTGSSDARPSSSTNKTSTSFATIASPSPPPPPSLTRDTFGFRQVIVAATHYGKVYGIDGSNGEIMWSRRLGLGWVSEVGGRVQPVKLFVLKQVGDVDVSGTNARGEAKPEVVIVTQRTATTGSTDTVIFHLDALTGEDSTGKTKQTELIDGVDVVQGAIVEVYIVNHDDVRVVALLDEFLQVHLYPNTEKSNTTFSTIAPSLNFALSANIENDEGTEQKPLFQHKRLVGHQITFDKQLSERHVAYPTWTFTLPSAEIIQATIPPASSKAGLQNSGSGLVASLGKVLGNRTTLYKYINPRLFVLLTAELITHEEATQGRRSGCGIYLIDGAKGSVIYKRVVGSRNGVLPGGVCDIKAVLTENWLVYHYWDEGDYGTASKEERSKGYRVVSVELYEGQALDEKTSSADMSAYAVDETNLTALEKSWVFPHGLTALTTTSTKFGITSKDIIVATENQKIQSLPRRLLNPRRPNRKPTSEESEEGLIPYDPMIPDDSRRVLSHNYTIAQTSNIITSPSLLESTSLVFAYGLDLFLTRVSPSNTFDILSESFNKAQLVLTVIGLGGAIVLTKPMVQRKGLREKWYQS